MNRISLIFQGSESLIKNSVKRNQTSPIVLLTILVFPLAYIMSNYMELLAEGGYNGGGTSNKYRGGGGALTSERLIL